MIVGTPKELKDNERRVGMIPGAVHELVARGHQVLIERGAGLGAGLPDEEYIAAGAEMVASAEEIFARADMIVKVKEPLAVERKRLRADQVLFTYLHLAPDAEQTQDLIQSNAICIAYETVTSARGALPLLTPMSEVAGRLAPQVGARALEAPAGGRGVLLGGVPGVAPAEVVILGGGVSGTHAAIIALGMGADVTVLDRCADVLKRVAVEFDGRVRTVFSNSANIAHYAARADLLIGTVLIPGAAAPKLITRAIVKSMKQGSVIVDISIDQGGCAETSRPTTHSNPTFVEHGVVHYCVTNMPGAVARTSTFALNNVTLPFTLALADKGWKQAMRDDVHLAAGLNVAHGKVTCEPVAQAQLLVYVPVAEVIAA